MGNYLFHVFFFYCLIIIIILAYKLKNLVILVTALRTVRAQNIDIPRVLRYGTTPTTIPSSISTVLPTVDFSVILDNFYIWVPSLLVF